MSASYNILKLGPFNPIMLRVVTAGGKRLRHAFTRWGYLALLMVVLLITLVVSTGGGNMALSELAKGASNVFSWISYVQLGMICLLAPVFCASAITQERDSQTYNILLATPLTNAQIVLGSLLSRLYYVVALLLSGVPVFLITLLYGGVTGSSIVLSFAIALSTALFTGSLAIAIAVFRLGSGRTVFWFYVFNAIYLVALLLVDWFWLSDPAKSGQHHTTWLTGIHPFLALQSVVSPTAYPTPDQTTLAGMNRLIRWYLGYPAYAYLTITTAASLAMVLPSAIVLRRIAQRSDAGLWSMLGSILRRGKEDRSRRPRNVWANPVAWREAVTRAGFSGRGLMRWVTVVAGLAAAIAVIALYQGWRAAALAAATPDDVLTGLDEARNQARMLVLGLVIVELSVALLVATNTSASAVTKERESATLDLLLVTPITSRYYIWGKLRGLVSFMLPFAVVPTMTVLLLMGYELVAGMRFAMSELPMYQWENLGAGAGPRAMAVAGAGFWTRTMHYEWVVHWETVLSLPVLLTAMLAWACMLGLQLSLKWSRTIVAVMASVGVLAGVCGVLGICGFAIARNLPYVGTLAALASPYTALCILIDPAGFSVDFGPNGWCGDHAVAGRILVFFVTMMVSAGYCLIISWMYKSMVRNFDMIIRRQHQ
jgi:ABC-type transport system involved in multi-copper enzyme maturation permease subunit